jgi:RNA-binding protein
MSKPSSQEARQLRAIGHRLKPVVTVAGKGVSDAVVAEIDGALERHELIKIKLAVGDRDQRSAAAEAIRQRTGAEIIQSIGNVVLVLRRSTRPDPRLSNLIRPL